jgi:hypothetical protein
MYMHACMHACVRAGGARVPCDVPRVTHYSKRCVLSAWKFVEIEEIHRFGSNHRLLRIDHTIQKGVHAFILIGAGGADGLLAHRALVSVTRGLVVMWVRHKPSHDAQQRKRVDFHVCVVWGHLALVQGYKTVIFLVHVHVLNDAILRDKKSVRVLGLEMEESRKKDDPYFK